MNPLKLTFLWGLWFCLFSHDPLLAGEIRGRVIDVSTQKPLGGVNLFFLPERVRAATSDEQGNFLISVPSPGVYRLMASYIGYNTQIKEVEVGNEGVATLNFAIILSVLDVETPIVAASKREQALVEAPTAVSVLFAKDVAEAEEATTFAEALKYIPGLDYAKGSEGNYNIAVRGFNGFANNTVLLLIDGRILNAVPDHSITWAGLSIAEQEIERIEVIKGPGSALYGANAFSGVINIVTKAPREMAGTTVRVSGGSRGTFSAAYAGAGVRGKLGYKISAGFFENDNFVERMPFDTLAAYRQFPDNVRMIKGDAKITWQAANETQLVFSGGGVAQNNVLFLPSTNRTNTEKANDFYLNGKWQHQRFKIHSYYNRVRTDTIRVENARTPLFSFRNHDLYKFEAQQSLHWGKKNELIFGVEYLWQRFDTKGILIPQVVTQSLFGLYGQYETWLRSNLGLILAGRVDHHPTVDFQVSPKAGLIYILNTENSFRLTVNQAYVNPVFLELYTDFLAIQTPTLKLGVRGNKKLDPRKITAFEAGYQGFIWKKLRINVDLYHYNLKNFISPLRVINYQNPSAVSYVNFGQVNAEGIDFGLIYLIGRGLRWSFNLSAIRTDKTPVASATPNEDTTDEIPSLNAPRLKLGSSLRYENPRGFYVNAAVRFVNDFDWAEEVTVPLPRTVLTGIESYAVADIMPGYRVPNRDTQISITASNVFDRKYIELPRGSFIRRKIIGSITTRF